MRKACAAAVADLGEQDPDLVALGADGFSVFTEFAARYPDRFIDVGIAEANLVGIASGLARSGKRVMVATIAAFLLRRAYEHIRNDVCVADLPVTFIGLGGGLAYGRLGPTHHLIEDVALFSMMPNTTVFVPADVHDAVWAVRQAANLGPVYVRLGARDDPLVHTGNERFEVGIPHILRAGTNVAVVANGICVAEALAAADCLAMEGFDAAVVNVHTVKPLAPAALDDALGAVPAVVVVEEHHRSGGLGALAREYCGVRLGDRLALLGVDDRKAPIGTREELLRFYGLDREAIAAACRLAMALAS